jgi:hypothetical protein
MNIKISKKAIDKNLQDMALIMTLHCVRNTVIESYHAAGKLTNFEMKAFNKEVADKIYSFLQLLLNPYYADIGKAMFFNKVPFNIFYMPSDWDKPKFDKEFLSAFKIIKGQKTTSRKKTK